jgi:GT2 family glycosyltransferase/glycosyltransferase involved in cell wall biosynthesis
VVLFASYSGALGGAERLLIGWALSLDGERCLACPEGPLAAAARACGIRVLPLRERSLELRSTVRDRLLAPVRLAGHRREVRALVSSVNPEVLVVCGMWSAIACLSPGRRPAPRPALVFQHSDLLPGPAIARLVRRAARRADLVLTLSHTIAADLDSVGSLGDRMQVVQPGVDRDRFGDGAPPADPFGVLMVGAIAESKRPDLALEALAIARRDRPGMRLRIVGAPLTPGDERILERLRARAAEPDLAGSVELVGSVEHPRAELERAACLLHCAPREAFGMVVLEALAAGRPAVVPDSAGPAEIVDRSCGILYPPEDVRAAAEGLVRLAADPALAAEMGAAGRRRASEQFGVERARSRWAAAVGRLRAARAPRVDGPTGGLQIVTVTHNSAAALGGLLASVERHLPGTTVIVVDCASTDDTLAVAERSPSARVIALDRNVGFGTACNRGMQEVTAPFTALLNPDVELLDSSLLEAVAELSRPGSGERLIAPLALNADGTRQDTVHPAPASGAELALSLVSPSALPPRAATALAPWLSPAPRRVGWAVGCALLARTETLRRLGPFDERLFMYSEDLDLCLRAGGEGIETWFWPAARVVHHRAHSSSAAFGGEPFELLARARREVVARRLGPVRAAVDDAAQALTFVSRIAVKGALGRPTRRERRQLQALRAARHEGA